MPSRLNPYINLRTEARAALEFYKSVLGGELVISTFGEFGMSDEGLADLVMHGQLETEAGYTLMVSDLPPGMTVTNGDSVTISISGDDADQLRGYWAGLTEGATITTPLETQMWGDDFGTFVDKFGVSWMINISTPAEE